MSYRIILTDDHEMFRAGLKSLINQEVQLTVAGEARDGVELLRRLQILNCDCIVLDLSMPNMDGVEAMKIIRRKYPKVKVLVLTMQRDPTHFRRAMEQGAWGYVLKDDAYEQLVLALKTIMAGKKFISPSISAFLTDRFTTWEDPDEQNLPSLESLTYRERQILKLIANGLANKQIALKLNISIRTAETHRLNLNRKLKINSTAGLVKYAIAQGLV
jgi:two-component system, NarL family, response regulator NreC